MAGCTYREDALLCAGFFLVATRASERRCETKLVQRLFQRLGFHDVRVVCRAMIEWVDPVGERLLVRVNSQVEPHFASRSVTEGDHLAELPGRVDVQERKRERGGIEGLPSDVQEHGAVLSYRVQQYGPFTLGYDCPEDLDAFSFQVVEMV
jgi:hypothetical protein